MLNIQNITRLRINEGTMEQPFVLTAEERQTLIALANAKNQNIDIRGVVDTHDHLISAFHAYLLREAFPNLTVIAEVQIDTNWSVTLSKDTVNEGESVRVVPMNTSLEILRCSIDSIDLEVTGGQYTKEAIIANTRIDMATGVITAARDDNNSSWNAAIRFRFAPVYIENPTDADCKFAVLTVRAKGVTGVQTEVASVVGVGRTAEVTLSPLPADTTKQSGLTYGLTAAVGSTRYNTVTRKWEYTAPATEQTDTLTASVLLNDITVGMSTKQVTASRPYIAVEFASDDETLDTRELQVTIKDADGAETKIGAGEKMYVKGDGSETYGIVAPSVKGYKADAVSQIKPSGVANVVKVTYSVIKPDVYLVYSDGSTETYDTLSARNFAVKAGKTAVGIGVASADCSFMIAGRNETASKQWSTNKNEHINVGGYPQTTTDGTLVRSYFEGIKNTEAIITRYNRPDMISAGQTAPAATYCREKTLDVGGASLEGYLPSIGEMLLFCSNKSKINEILVYTFVAERVNMNSGNWWSSCQYYAGDAWCLFNGSPNGNLSKAYGYQVRPFYAF